MKQIYMLSIILLTIITGHAQPGTLYTGFSTDGYDIQDLSAGNRGAENAGKVMLQADGKKLVAFEANYSQIMVARYNLDGSLDITYGEGGFSQPTGDIGFIDFSAAIQPDGKVVVAGADWGAIQFDFYVYRLNTNGTLDQTFGTGGMVRLDFGFDDELKTVLVQPDGKILVGGTTDVNNQFYLAFARFNADGTLDGTFGFSGRYVTVAFEGWNMVDMELLPDGKIAAIADHFTGNDLLLARYTPGGILDVSFNTYGYIEHDLNAYVNALSIQADGKWVVAGANSNTVNNDFFVARFLTSGFLDPSFHGNGKNSTNIGGTDIAYDLAIAADGKIVLGGYSRNTNAIFSLARFTTAGELDGTFGVQGSEITSFTNEGYTGSVIKSILIQPDGQVIAVGIASKESQGFVSDIGMAFYSASGQFENRFVSWYEDNGYASFWAAAVQPDGKPVLAGYVWNGIDYDFLVGRYNMDGTPDGSFGTNGFTKTDFSGNDLSVSSSEFANSILIQPDGKIIVAGSFYGSNDSRFAVARYNSNGTLDNTFDVDGVAVLDPPGNFDNADALALQPDGKILVGGNTDAYDFDYALMRLLPDGTPDITFDGDGTAISNWAYQDQIYGLAIQSDGKILAAGVSSAASGYLDFNIARYNTNGTLDNTFGDNGRQTTDFFGSYEFANDVAIQPDGKIIVSGSVINTDNLSYDFGIARYNSNGTRDLTFGNNGKVVTDFGGDDRTFSMNMQTDGKFYVTGYSEEQSDIVFDESTGKDVAIAKYNADGSLNGCFGDRGKVLSDLGSKEYIYASALGNGKLYVAGNSQTYHTFVNESKYSGLVAAYNLTGGVTTLSCPPGGSITANTDAGQCYATITNPLINPLFCPDDATGTINYSISRNNVVIETGTGSVSGKRFSTGNTSVTYTVSQQPSLTCSFLVTVNDAELPTLVCPAAQLVDVGSLPGCMGLMPDLRSQAVGSDNCTSSANLVVMQTPLPGTSISGDGPLAVQFTVRDAAGNESAPCSITVLKSDLSGPHVDVCANAITRNVTAGRCDAVVSLALLGPPVVTEYCGGAVTTTNNIPAGNVFPVGQTTVTWNFMDIRGNVSHCTQVVTIVDNEPPVITGESANPVVLSPANHTMRNVYIGYTATDNCAVTTTLSVTSNEPVNGVGDGDTSPDWIVTNNHNVQLRSERSAAGTGRIYTITIRAIDTYGNITTKTVEVRVPHNIINPRSGQPFALNSTVNFRGEFWDRQGSSHTPRWLIDGSTVASGIVTEPTATQNGKITGSYKFTAPGVYKLQMNVTDQNGITNYSNSNGDLDATVVIYDPNGGYTYGGGWFQSLPGALSNSQATGKASYGFAVNYRNAARPKGETQFQFKVGNIEFNALNFDYLVVAGAKAQFRGTGKIVGGQSGISFIMTVIDGRLDGSSIGKIRLKIYKGSIVYYDNQPGASDAANPTQAVAENSIIYIDGAPAFAARNGIKENVDAPLKSDELSIFAFPNPADDQFNLKINSSNKQDFISLQVTDQAGRIIFTRITKEGEVIRFGGDLVPGMYYLNAVQGELRNQVKLIKL